MGSTRQPDRFPVIWQPFTPAGVAAFAGARLGRLLLVEGLVAFFIAGCLIWFLDRCHVPVITRAIQQMPDGAALQGGRLEGVPSQALAESRFLTLVVDMTGAGEHGGIADLHLDLEARQIEVWSLFGALPVAYPAVDLPLGRTRLEPWWGAWQKFILAGAGALTALGLWISWAVLACVYASGVLFLAFVFDRETTWRGAWKLSSAAQMPPALLIGAAIVLYGLQWVGLAALLVFWGMHLLIAWGYLILATLRLPRLPGSSPNPFARPPGNAAPPRKR